jgi:hypothetical protein
MNDQRKTWILGTCTAQDVALHHQTVMSELGGTIVSKVSEIPSKLSTLATPPGPIAERLQEEMHLTIDTMPYNVRRQYNNIVKRHSLTDLSQQVGQHDTLIFDLHAELYLTYYDGCDEFAIRPDYFETSKYFPEWFRHKVRSVMTVKADLMSPEQNARRQRQLIQVTEQLDKIFFGRVIMISNVFSKKIHVESVGAAGKELLLPELNVSIPFLTVTEYGRENIINQQFYERMYELFYQRARRILSHWQHIIPDKDKCVADPNHRWGPHPCHLHPTSLDQFGPQLITAFNNLNNKRSIILP